MINEENKRFLDLLRYDFESSATPDPYGPKTQRNLEDIVYRIKLGKMELQELTEFVDTELRNSDFGKCCLMTVRRLLGLPYSIFP